MLLCWRYHMMEGRLPKIGWLVTVTTKRTGRSQVISRLLDFTQNLGGFYLPSVYLACGLTRESNGNLKLWKFFRIPWYAVRLNDF